MHQRLIAFFILLSLPITAQTALPPKPAPHKPVAPAQPTAIIDTTAGKLTCTLFPDKAPIGVKNFIGLARGTKDWTDPKTNHNMHGVPLYNGTIFHRVIPEFMIQGGSPSGEGDGTPGYEFKNETSPDLTFDRPGRLAYANAGPDTNGSQFFVTEVPYPSLDGHYTIFGQCDMPSVELVNKIARMPRDTNPGPNQDRPNNPVKITKITILHAGGAAAHAAAHKPATKTSTQTH
jgi:peptidyl-prolyl cis-trans isomerase A (cyclophilin A)